MIGGKLAVERIGQRARLHGADPHHRDAIGACRRHDCARFGRPVEKFESTGGVEQIGDALHCGRRRALAEQSNDRVRMTDPSQSPRADHPLRNQVLERKTILLHIWGTDDFFAGRSLDVFITRLRKYHCKSIYRLSVILSVALEQRSCTSEICD